MKRFWNAFARSVRRPYATVPMIADALKSGLVCFSRQPRPSSAHQQRFRLRYLFFVTAGESTCEHHLQQGALTWLLDPHAQVESKSLYKCCDFRSACRGAPVSR